jgi:hypothetical protein
MKKQERISGAALSGTTRVRCNDDRSQETLCMLPRTTVAFAALASGLLAGCQAPSSSSYRARPAPPLHVTAARGIDPGVKLADFRGKWLLIDFWAHW